MARRLRVAFVIPRYGPEIAGGAEQYCREVAESLAGDMEIEVLTTCALHYERWKDYFPAGSSEINGVTVRRFPVSVERDPDYFAAFGDRAIVRPHSPLDELQWILLQGPVSSQLLSSIRDERSRFDVYVFWTYLYCPTVLGMPSVADKALFVPLAHDEPPFHLEIMRPLFYLPRHIVFNSQAEKELVERRFGPSVSPNTVIGVGVDAPQIGNAERFREKYGINDDFLLYLGRLTPSKGCDELLDYFATYKALRPGRLKLVLVGNVEMDITPRPDLHVLGFVDEEAKADALAAASISVSASRFESFSISMMESWLARRPMLAHADCAPMKQHVMQSGGGLLFDDAASFCAAVDRLQRDRPLRDALAESGNQYASSRYTRDVVRIAWKATILVTVDAFSRQQLGQSTG